MSFHHSDPTANAAISHVDREIRAQQRRREAALRARDREERQEVRAEEAPRTIPAGRPTRGGWTLAWTDRRGRIG